MKAQNGGFVREQLEALLATDLHVPAVLYDARWSTWADLAERADVIEARLVDLSVPRRGRVALVLRNRPSGLAALLGLLAAARVPALVSPIQPAASIAAAAEALDPVAVLIDEADFAGDVESAAARCGAAFLVQSPDSVQARGAVDAAPVGARRLVDDEIALIVPTSGTTGPPKAIPLYWSQLPFDSSRGIRAPVSPTSRPPVIQALSMATITGVMGTLRAAAAARPLALLERVDVDQWSRLVEQFQLRHAGLPPAAMRTMLDDAIPAERLASLEAWQTGSAPLSPDLQRDFEETFGVPVLVAYGATEFGGAAAAWTLDMHRKWRDQKLGSVGRAVEGVELRIVDPETGDALAAGAPGRLDVRVRGASGTDANGWLRTNDRATIDDDGFLYLHGRLDDVIVRGGFKVPLGDLEALLREHPDVRDAGAVGVPEPRLGQVPAVAVVLEGNATTTIDELRAWIRDRTAPYKVPTVMMAVDSLPMGASHKVNRPELRALLAGDGPAEAIDS